MSEETKTKHTPGPWERYGNVIQSDSTGIVVCEIEESGKDDYRPNSIKESQANARLIAVAPELLEAIKAVKIRIAFIGHPNEPMKDGKPDWSKEIKLIEQAHAKAEGK
jgi:hypothetical protein